MNTRSVLYNGVLYPSLAKAADSLHVAPAAVYAYGKKHGVSREEALDYVVKRASNTKRGDGKKKPVVFRGVSYPSQAAVLSAYNVARVTVTSRMGRNGWTFEESLETILQYRQDRPSEMSLFNEELVQNASITTEKILETNQRYLYDRLKPEYPDISILRGPSYFILKFNASLPASPIADCFILLSGRSIEAVIPVLQSNIREGMELYQKINRFNRDYLGSKIWIKETTLGASWNTWIVNAWEVSILNAFHSIRGFLKSCDRFLQEQ